jgi:hypothetical protein
MSTLNETYSTMADAELTVAYGKYAQKRCICLFCNYYTL